MEYGRCSLEKCNGFSNASGLCWRHRTKTEECLVAGCDKLGVQKDMCTRHYTRALIYGLTGEQLSELLARGKCDACGQVTNKLNIDHDHSCCESRVKACGKCVRGVLCTPCNQALGFLKDDPDKILGLLEYLAT